MFPGLNKACYEGEYWSHIDRVQDEATLRFIENALYLVPLGPREYGFSVLSDTNITPRGAGTFEATDRCWDAILARHPRWAVFPRVTRSAGGVSPI